MRYRDPVALSAGMARLAPSPERDVLLAFLAWREQRHDDALRRTETLLATAALDGRWTVRTRSVQACVLAEIGLIAEAVNRHLENLSDTRRRGDRMGVAATTHDLAVAYAYADPERALATHLQAVRLARTAAAHDPARTDEARALEALAVLNVMDLHVDYGLPLPTGLPTLAETEELARPARPELAGSIRANRVLGHIERGDVEAAVALAGDIPDPTTMRDIVAAAAVARVRARLAAVRGDLHAARTQIEDMLAALPITSGAELLDDLSDICERLGDYPAALAAARRRADVIVRRHTDEARTAVRALEVWHRTREAEADARSASAAADRLRARLAEMDRDKERLRELTTRDGLTGLSNRVHLGEFVESLDDGPHELALIDLDRFKEINDSWGHLMGDEALRTLADALRAACSPHDLVVRYGGDEFLVLRPQGTAGPLARDLADVVRVDGLAGVGGRFLTASIGIARLRGADLEGALRRADELLYRAKRAGGGAVESDLPVLLSAL